MSEATNLYNTRNERVRINGRWRMQRLNWKHLLPVRASNFCPPKMLLKPHFQTFHSVNLYIPNWIRFIFSCFSFSLQYFFCSSQRIYKYVLMMKFKFSHWCQWQNETRITFRLQAMLYELSLFVLMCYVRQTKSRNRSFYTSMAKMKRA